MKHIAIVILCSFLFLCGCAQVSENAHPKKFPEAVGYVNDFEKIFKDDEVDNLTELLQLYQNTTTNQISILTIDSISPYESMKEFNKDLFNEWGIGLKNENNGLLITLSKNLREVFITTGLGTEKILSDSTCNSIVQTYMIPRFREGQYYEGVMDGSKEIIKVWGEE